jgi:adenylosuccinate lyase
MKVWAGEGDFLALLEADPAVAGKVPPADLAACFDNAYHSKHVATIFDRVFKDKDPV